MGRAPRVWVAAALLATALAAASPPARAEEPVCRRWKLDVVCAVAPSRIALGEEFTATVSARNAGDVALADVTIQLRADAGALCIAGSGTAVQTLVPRLEPGETKQVTARFLPETVGTARVLGTARDALGWAAGNCVCEVEITGFPGLSASISTTDAKGEPRTDYRPGETFTYVVEVTNDPARPFPPDLRVELALPKAIEFTSGKADGGATVSGRGRRAVTTAFRLSADKSAVRVEFTVKAVAASPGLRLKAHATVLTATGVALTAPVATTGIEEPPPPEPPPAKAPPAKEPPPATDAPPPK